jgi:hypothetical protein
MALVLADRVRDTTATTGTGTVTLSGTAPTGYQNFSVIGNGNTTYYTINSDTQWEVGVGTYTSSGTTLARNTVLASSNGGALVDFAAGTKDVFVTYPSEKAVTEDYGNALAATTAANLAGGAAGSIPYQTAANTTAMLATGTGVLIGGTTPSYTMSPSLTQVTVAGDPTVNLQVATKQYVDTQTSAGIHFHQPVRVESPINLNATYNNGSSGVGATLTNAGTQAALVIDGVTLSVADRVLVYEQTDETQNGIYVVTSVGSGSTNWVLTRSSDADTYVNASPDGLSQGSTVFVQQGTTGAGETYTCNTVGTIVFGTTAITFAQISSAQIYSAGTGLTLTGTTFSLTSPVATTLGGTGLTSFTTGGAVYATSSSTLTTGTLPATAGGTGQSSYTAGDLLYATSSTTIGVIADVATGNALISGGAGADPSYGKIGLTTHITGTLAVGNGGTGATSLTGYLVGNGTSAFTATATIPTSALSGTISLTTQVSGTLGVGNGGTGISSYTVGDILYASATTTLSSLADVATGNALISGGVSNPPSWGKIGLTTHVSGTLPVSNGGSGATTLTGYLKGNGTSAFTASATIPSGDITGAALTKADDTNVTLTLGGSPSTALLAATSITAGWSGQLAVSRGGTGNSTLTSGYLLKGNGVSPTSASVIYDDGTNVGIGNAAIPYTTSGRTVFNVNGTSSAIISLQTSGSNRGYFYGDGSTIAIEAESGCAIKLNTVSAQPMTFFTSNTERLSINSSGNVTANVDMRAPIFYDSNNTSYYLDPAGSSVLGIITAQSTNDAQLYLNGNGTSWAGIQWTDVSGSDNMWYNGSTSTFAIGGGGSVVANKKLHINGGTTIGSGIAASASGTNSLLVEASITANQMYAQIFYDSQNGAYYVDPASTSNLNDLNVASGNVLGAIATFNNMNQTHGQQSDFNAITNFGVRYVQGSANGPGISGATQYYGFSLGLGSNYPYSDFGSQFYWPRTAVGGLPYPSVRFRESGTWSAWSKIYAGWADAPSGATFAASGDFRAPIFYDSNNTAYYVDPASGSVLNRLVSITGAGNSNGGNLQLGDKDVNTAKWSVLTGAHYAGSSEPKGVMLIGSYSASGNNSLSIGGNIYEANPATYIAFYTATTATHPTGGFNRLNINGSGNVTAEVDIRSPIYYDSNNTAYYLDPASRSILGNISVITGATECGIRFRGDTLDFVGRYGGYMSLYNQTTGGEFKILDAGYFNFNQYAVNEASFRAPIFYDQNDTGYYLDPNGFSNLNRANFIAQSTDTSASSIYLGGQNVTTSGSLWINFHSDGDTNYRIGKPAGAWTQPLEFRFYTGQRFKASASYGGFQFIDFNTNGVVFDMANGGSFTRSIVAFYAPIMYDNDNSAFFVDPNSTSVLSTVRAATIQHSSGNRAITLNGSTWTEFCDVNGSTKLWLGGSGDPNNYYNAGIHYFRNTSSSTTMTIDSSGNVVATANVTAYSDARLKKDVETIGDALGLVGKMRGVRYTRIDTEKRNVGVIAQEMLEVIPEVVHQGTGDDDTLSVAYGNLVGVLIEAIKELEARVAELEGK